MASAFKSKVSAAVGTSLATIYSPAAATTATVIGLSVANITGSTITVDVQLVKNSPSATVYLIKSAPVPPGSSVVVVGGDQKVVLETLDIVKVISSAATSADVVMSILELT